MGHVAQIIHDKLHEILIRCPVGKKLLGRHRHKWENNMVCGHWMGHAVAHLVETLRCRLEGRGFDSRWCHCNFSLT